MWFRLKDLFAKKPRVAAVLGRRLVFEPLSSRALLDASGFDLSIPAEGEGEQAPTFSLVDVNPSSGTSGQRLSPEDYQGQVSAWYFIHTT